MQSSQTLPSLPVQVVRSPHSLAICSDLRIPSSSPTTHVPSSSICRQDYMDRQLPLLSSETQLGAFRFHGAINSWEGEPWFSSRYPSSFLASGNMKSAVFVCALMGLALVAAVMADDKKVDANKETHADNTNHAQDESNVVGYGGGGRGHYGGGGHGYGGGGHGGYGGGGGHGGYGGGGKGGAHVPDDSNRVGYGGGGRGGYGGGGRGGYGGGGRGGYGGGGHGGGHGGYGGGGGGHGGPHVAGNHP